MADVSNVRRLDHLRHQPIPPPRHVSSNAALVSPRQEASVLQEELYYRPTPYLFDLDSFSPPRNPSGSYNLDYTGPFSLGFDTSSETETLGSEDGDEDDDANYFVYSSDEEAEQMHFVSDIFDSREARAMELSNWEVDPERVENSDLEFGFGPGLNSNAGLRDVGMDLESDSAEFVVNTRFINDDYEYDSFEVNSDVYLSANESLEFEWEEVSQRNNSEESEVLNSVIDRIEEISVSSEISATESEISSRLGDDDDEEEEDEEDEEEGEEEDEDESNLEWEVLLAMNDLERNNSLDTDSSEFWPRNLPEDYILAMESNEVFAQLMENATSLKRSPPAAKSVVEKLPSVVLTKDEVGESNACAVCMDEFPVGEKLTRMPCFHLYHRECILPWLRSRNTCPVCRYELATDDAIYEKRRRARAGGRVAHFADIFEPRYNRVMLA